MTNNGNVRRLLLLALLGLAACNQPPDKKVAALETKVASLEGRVAREAENSVQLQKDLVALEWKVESADDSEAVLDPTDQGYAFVRTRAGSLLVAVDNMTPYGDGQKLTLRIGNPMAITFNGFTVQVKYGRRFPKTTDSAKWQEEYKARQDSMREKEMKLTDTLRPGTWNKVTMILAPASPAEVGYLSIRIAVDNVGLADGRR
jgi:hypothetical protein